MSADSVYEALRALCAELLSDVFVEQVGSVARSCVQESAAECVQQRKALRVCALLLDQALDDAAAEVALHCMKEMEIEDALQKLLEEVCDEFLLNVVKEEVNVYKLQYDSVADMMDKRLIAGL